MVVDPIQNDGISQLDDGEGRDWPYGSNGCLPSSEATFVMVYTVHFFKAIILKLDTRHASNFLV